MPETTLDVVNGYVAFTNRDVEETTSAKRLSAILTGTSTTTNAGRELSTATGKAAQNFRTRIIRAHLHLLRELADQGGLVVLLSDVRGFAFDVYGTDHDEKHRRVIPLVPRQFPELVRENFEVVVERQWEWITDLPEKDKFGRGYEVAGYVLKC